MGDVGGSSDVGASGLEENYGGGSRWPRQQTLALLKIRSDMDPVFRDATLKAPLWEEVSRKMAELGFQRSAKKCREKFENVYKYHKRTKDGRASKPDGKTYKFFDQLEALEQPLISPPLQPPPPTTNYSNSTAVPSLPTSPTPLTVLPPSSNPATFLQPPTTNTSHFKFSSTETSSSSTSSDEERRRGKKRKLKDYLQRLIRDVVEKQEKMHKRFMEALEKVERDRITREEARRVEEIARKNKEHDLLLQEKSMAAAKDAALLAFLNKIQALPFPSLQLSPTPIQAKAARMSSGSSSRWPKPEVQALINLRTSFDLKDQDTGSKGFLWEEISTEMAKLGYNRSSKKCKEKWENINKYYKRVKESNKKRPEDSKTCPYFHQLEAIYSNTARNDLGLNNNETYEEDQEEDDDEMEDDEGVEIQDPMGTCVKLSTQEKT